MSVKLTHLPKSQIELVGELPEKEFSAYRGTAIKHLASEVEIDGFRRGYAPEAVLLRKVGEMAVLEEMAHVALNELYPKLVAEHRLDVIGAPEIGITKLGIGGPLGFKIKSAVMPELKLPEYSKIAKEMNGKRESVGVDDKEVDEALEEIRKQRAIKKEGGDMPHVPELNDEFARSLGKFENLNALKTKLKENIRLEKELRGKEKHRSVVLEKIAEVVKAEIPDILTDIELDKMAGRLRGDLERLGLTWDGYLKNLNKKEEELRKEWRPQAESRAKIELLLMKIAEKEKLAPGKEEIEKEVGHVREHYKDADPERVRDYVTHLLTNEKVLEFLESC